MLHKCERREMQAQLREAQVRCGPLKVESPHILSERAAQTTAGSPRASGRPPLIIGPANGTPMGGTTLGGSVFSNLIFDPAALRVAMGNPHGAPPATAIPHSAPVTRSPVLKPAVRLAFDGRTAAYESEAANMGAPDDGISKASRRTSGSGARTSSSGCTPLRSESHILYSHHTGSSRTSKPLDLGHGKRRSGKKSKPLFDPSQIALPHIHMDINAANITPAGDAHNTNSEL